jgi:transposase
MERALLEDLLRQGLSLAAIGRRVGLHEASVAYWVKKHGLRAAHRNRHASAGGLTREQLEPLVADGLSIAQIAERVGRSKATVRHWLMRHGQKTSGSRGSKARRQARAQGLRTLELTCPRHGETEFRLDGRGYYRCKQCCSDAVARRRRKMKSILVQEAGGVCRICGYGRSMRALHFHHVEPSEKRHEINARGVALALEALRREAQKCVLLCSNCHAEVEEGLACLPAAPLQTPSGRSCDPG